MAKEGLSAKFELISDCFEWALTTDIYHPISDLL